MSNPSGGRQPSSSSSTSSSSTSSSFNPAQQGRKSGSSTPSDSSSFPGGDARARESMSAQTKDAIGRASGVAQAAGVRVKEEASSLVQEANQKATSFFTQQLKGGADFAGQLAGSVKSAADELSGTAPQLAELVRGGADKIETIAEELRAKSPQELWREAGDFTRRQPALVFGLASVAGFLLFRVLKAAPSSAAHQQSHGHAGYAHGA